MHYYFHSYILHIIVLHNYLCDKCSPFEPLEVTTWLKRVAREWRWLMRQSRHLISIASEQAFNEQVLSSHEFWIVVFLDGFHCSACQTAKTNVMRLAASLKGLRDVKVGIVNCEDPGNSYY